VIALDADVSAAIRCEGRATFEKHGEVGETNCPYPSGRGSDARRMAWWSGFLEARTNARLHREGIEP
jgi:hypothetical protein